MKKSVKKPVAKKTPRRQRVASIDPDYDPPTKVLKHPPAYLLRTPTPDNNSMSTRPRAWLHMKQAWGTTDILVREFLAMEKLFGVECKENLIFAIRHWNGMTQEERDCANCPMAQQNE